MIIGFLEAELFMQHCQSLKDKRMIVQSVKEKVSKKFNVAVAETEFMDKWQRALLAFVTVANNKSFVEEILNKIFHLIDTDFRYEIVNHKFGYK
jgi:hypothetical protein